MALSANAARALEQVKMGLFMLYGAGYFTEDEWVKVDGLIHKGKYVFTSGPPSHLEAELMSFEDSIDELKPHSDVQVHTIELHESAEKDNEMDAEMDTEKETTTVSSETTPSPLPSDGAESSPSPAETLSGTSADISSDDENASPPPPSAIEAAPMFDFDQTTASAVTAPAEAPPVEEEPQMPSSSANGANGANGNLPKGCTQEQLDEVRKFNATLTKAGQKQRQKYTPPEDTYSSQGWTERGYSPEPTNEEQAYPSPPQTEQDSRIQYWASEIGTEESAPRSTAPLPAHDNDWTRQDLVNNFIEVHGRPPTSINDIYQPKNPQWRPKRSESRASSTKTTLANLLPQATSGISAQLKVPPNTVLIAQSSAPQKSQMHIDVIAGDKIKVIKHVSGIMHIGENLRTKQRGQFAENIFKKSPSAKIDGSLIGHQRGTTGSMQASSGSLDRVERINASEWDRDDVSVAPRARPTAPVRSPTLGLAASRFSALADIDTKSHSFSSEPPEITHAMMREEMGKMFDEKILEMMRAKAIATAASQMPSTAAYAQSRFSTPLLPVQPKTETCWFWKTPNKECRFTSEECRDLHAHLPVQPDNPTNLRMGRPTWGSLGDSLEQMASLAEPKKDPKGRTMTCWYWANNDKCNNTAETCKYLHEHTNGPSGGVAQRPWKKQPAAWALATWTRGSEMGNTSAEGEGELILEQVQEPDNSGWGVSNTSTAAAPTPADPNSAAGWGLDTTWNSSSNLNINSMIGWGESPTDKYKPPHIKALQEKNQIEAVGW